MWVDRLRLGTNTRTVFLHFLSLIKMSSPTGHKSPLHIPQFYLSRETDWFKPRSWPYPGLSSPKETLSFLTGPYDNQVIRLPYVEGSKKNLNVIFFVLFCFKFLFSLVRMSNGLQFLYLTSFMSRLVFVIYVHLQFLRLRRSRSTKILYWSQGHLRNLVRVAKTFGGGLCRNGWLQMF